MIPLFVASLNDAQKELGGFLLTSLALVVTLAEAFETVNWIQMAQLKLATQAYRGPSLYQSHPYLPVYLWSSFFSSASMVKALR